MRLATPESAILSAVIFNALIIIALIPLALRGVPYRAVGAAQLLRDNLLIYGRGRLDRAVHRDQVDRYAVGPASPGIKEIMQCLTIPSVQNGGSCISPFRFLSCCSFWITVSIFPQGGHSAVQIGILLLIYGLDSMWMKRNTRALSEMDQKQYGGSIVVTRSQTYHMPEMNSKEHQEFSLPRSGFEREDACTRLEWTPVKRNISC